MSKLIEDIIVFACVRILWFVGSFACLLSGATIVLGILSRRRYLGPGPADGMSFPIYLLLQPESWYVMMAICALIALFGPTIRTYHLNRGRGDLEKIRARSIVRPWMELEEPAIPDDLDPPARNDDARSEDHTSIGEPGTASRE